MRRDPYLLALERLAPVLVSGILAAAVVLWLLARLVDGAAPLS